MLKRILAVLLAISLPATAALAEVYIGKTVASGASTVTAQSDGTLQSLNLTIGQTIVEGEILGSLRPEKVFATENGTVANIHAEDGEAADGAVLEIAPRNRYTVYCTVAEARQTPENTLVHCGETLYLRCTTNGTHQAVGIVTQIDGKTYQVEVIGGELYIGETVNLYRDSAFTYSLFTGVGTVVSADPIAYEIDGSVLEMRVEEGEEVLRGELLFTWAKSDSVTITSESAGIVTGLSVAPGDSMQKGQVIAEIVSPDDIRIEIQVDEADVSGIRVGGSAIYIRADDRNETLHSGTVESISGIGENGSYTVTILPDENDLPLGLSMEVRIGE